MRINIKKIIEKFFTKQKKEYSIFDDKIKPYTIKLKNGSILVNEKKYKEMNFEEKEFLNEYFKKIKTKK